MLEFKYEFYRGSDMQILVGQAAFSDFRLAQISKKIQLVTSKAILTAQFIYLIDSTKKLSGSELTRTHSLLDSVMEAAEFPPAEFSKTYFIITPREGTISPWSSKATDIFAHSGLQQVQRVERAIVYEMEAGITKEQLQHCAELVFDPMMESIFYEMNDLVTLFAQLPATTFTSIAILTEGKSALEQANKSLGLALNDDEIEYLSSTID